MAWDSKDTALAIQGVGALAGAWGQYESDKVRNRLLNEQFKYAQSQDAMAIEKQNLAQSNLEDAFDASALNKKKKKYDANGNEIVESTETATV